MKKHVIMFMMSYCLSLPAADTLHNVYTSFINKTHEYKQCLENQSCTSAQKLTLFGLTALLISTLIGTTALIQYASRKQPMASFQPPSITDLIDAVVNNDTALFFQSIETLKKLPLDFKTIAQQTAYTKEGYELPLLVIAAQYGNTRIVTTLIDMGADLNKDFPLHNAIYNNQTDAAIIIITKGANLNLPAGEGQTPLMLAVARCHVDVVRQLLAHGAKKEITDYEGKTALQQLQFYTNRCSANRDTLIRLLQ